jgi:dinuclear metal center YbgI/SA1388 family protein
MILSELVAALDRIAPTAFAESWDNVGLLVGNSKQTVSKAMLTIDYTPAVAEEVKSAGCDVVIAYHPPIFEALKRIPSSSLMFDAIRRGVAIYSPHTALDVADGGTNDMLADAVGLVARAPLRLSQPKATQYKLVTFVPEKDADPVSRALFAAGAGRIGAYSSCSFRTGGTGTFFGEEGTNPAVGQSDKLEHADEIRLETVVPISKVAEVITALRASHPYEEPAFDLNQLAAPPDGRGMGQVGTLGQPMARSAIIERIKRELSLTHLLIAGPLDGQVNKAAVCAGACGDLLNDALAAGVDLYLTGEMRHHDALKAARAGCTVVCTLHSNSERAVLKLYKSRIEAEAPGLSVMVSEVDRDPFVVH